MGGNIGTSIEDLSQRDHHRNLSIGRVEGMAE